MTARWAIAIGAVILTLIIFQSIVRGDASFWTAFGTCMLVLITGGAVYFGKRAADAAIALLRIEADPVIHIEALTPDTSPGITLGEVPQSNLAATYRISGNPTIADGPIMVSISGPRRSGENFVLAKAQNLGRSAAVDIIIQIVIRVPAIAKTEDPSTGWSDVVEYTGLGYLRIPAIAAGGFVYIQFLKGNIGSEIFLEVAPRGTREDQLSKPRRLVDVIVTSAGSIYLPPSS